LLGVTGDSEARHITGGGMSDTPDKLHVCSLPEDKDRLDVAKGAVNKIPP
jgi:hypothetical protein